LRRGTLLLANLIRSHFARLEPALRMTTSAHEKGTTEVVPF